MHTVTHGDRVRLIHCDDPYTRLRPGTEGTVVHVDDGGTVHVRWDTGSTLGLVAEAGDQWERAEWVSAQRTRAGDWYVDCRHCVTVISYHGSDRTAAEQAADEHRASHTD